MKPRILLVEDDLIAQDLTSAILISSGFEIDVAADGFAALQLMLRHQYRLALLDYHLPELDGYALAKLLRDAAKSGSWPLKLVGITADRHGLAARRGSDALFDTILVKPFHPQKLIDLVNAVAQIVGQTDLLPDVPEGRFADPRAERAREAVLRFWRYRGLKSMPKAYAFPSPSLAQAENLGTCFDLVDAESAEVLILLDAQGFERLAQIRTQRAGNFLPIVTIDAALSATSDVVFAVENPASWSELANCLTGFELSA